MYKDILWTLLCCQYLAQIDIAQPNGRLWASLSSFYIFHNFELNHGHLSELFYGCDIRICKCELLYLNMYIYWYDKTNITIELYLGQNVPPERVL